MLRRLYDWTMGLAGRRNALWALAAISFVESSVFPIPPDILLIPMVLAARQRAFLIAGVCTVASVLGGAAGYGIGLFLFDTVGRPVLEFYGQVEGFAQFAEAFNEQGWWLVFGAGLTPFPYKVITIASGATGLNFIVFMIASIVARGLRFVIVAGLLYLFGEPIRAFIERWLGPLFVVFVLGLVGGFVAIRYLW